jgi:phosphate transport system permease protein
MVKEREPETELHGRMAERSHSRTRFLLDRLARYIVFIDGTASFIILLAIAIFTTQEGLPLFGTINVFDFLSGTEWRPTQGQFGILPMIVGSVYVTLLSLLIAVPLGVACAVFLAEVAPPNVRRFFRPMVQLLVGIPSVVYGLVGMVIIVPFIRQFGGSGYSVLAASIVLMAMILPTIISISEDSLRAVPAVYKQGALALGATHWQTIWHLLIPVARAGIISSVIRGMGRAIGETMAMIMVIGNSVIIPLSPLDSARTLTGNIAVEIQYASGLHQNALFATGIILFVLIIVLNSLAVLVLRRGEVVIER